MSVSPKTKVQQLRNPNEIVAPTSPRALSFCQDAEPDTEEATAALLSRSENEPGAGQNGEPEGLEDRDTEQEQQQFAERQEAEINGPEEPLVDEKETMSGKAS